MSTTTESVDLVGDEAAANFARAALFAALVGAFGFVSFPIPVSSVPVTLQVLGVFLAGIMLGPVWGGASLVLYLAAGAVGAPVFSGGSAGIGVLFGSTGGYLWSYPIAATLVGAVVHRGADLRDLDDIGIPTFVGAMTLGAVVIYVFGMGGLMLANGLSVADAFAVGVLPFIPAEAIKMAAAIGIVRSDAVTAA